MVRAGNLPPDLCRLRGSLPADDVDDVTAFDVVDEASDDLERLEVRLGDQEVDVLTQRAGVIVDRKEAEVCAGASSQFVVGYSGKATLRVLHHDRGVDAEHMTRKSLLRKWVIVDGRAHVSAGGACWRGGVQLRGG